MKRFWQRSKPEATGDIAHAQDVQLAADSPQDPSSVAGDRGAISVDRTRSIQSRVSNLLAAGLMSVLAVGLLGWYYSQVIARQARAQTQAQAQSEAKTRGEMSLPPLGPIDPPVVERVLGPPPSLPDPTRLEPDFVPPPEASEARRSSGRRTRPEQSIEELAHDRRLSGDALVSADARAARDSPVDATDRTSAANPRAATTIGREADSDTSFAGGGGEIASFLQPTATPAARARLLPTQRLLLGKGSFIDCTLETALDSSLPGMTTCITATDTFGVDGSVVLLERGTKLTGETRGQVRQGAPRVFVLWTEARTPAGVVVPLASPGTDELGRAGLAGHVNRHFWERFGSAILVSVIDGAVQRAVQSGQDGDTVVINPSGSREIMTEALRSNQQIRDTVTKRNGDRIAVLVARDLDFRSVYELNHTNR